MWCGKTRMWVGKVSHAGTTCLGAWAQISGDRAPGRASVASPVHTHCHMMLPGWPGVSFDSTGRKRTKSFQKNLVCFIWIFLLLVLTCIHSLRKPFLWVLEKLVANHCVSEWSWGLCIFQKSKENILKFKLPLSKSNLSVYWNPTTSKFSTKHWEKS